MKIELSLWVNGILRQGASDSRRYFRRQIDRCRVACRGPNRANDKKRNGPLPSCADLSLPSAGIAMKAAAQCMPQGEPFVTAISAPF